MAILREGTTILQVNREWRRGTGGGGGLKPGNRWGVGKGGIGGWLNKHGGYVRKLLRNL